MGYSLFLVVFLSLNWCKAQEVILDIQPTGPVNERTVVRISCEFVNLSRSPASIDTDDILLTLNGEEDLSGTGFFRGNPLTPSSVEFGNPTVSADNNWQLARCRYEDTLSNSMHICINVANEVPINLTASSGDKVLFFNDPKSVPLGDVAENMELKINCTPAESGNTDSMELRMDGEVQVPPYVNISATMNESTGIPTTTFSISSVSNMFNGTVVQCTLGSLGSNAFIIEVIEECMRNEYRCGSSCISYESLCDGVVDCSMQSPFLHDFLGVTDDEDKELCCNNSTVNCRTLENTNLTLLATTNSSQLINSQCTNGSLLCNDIPDCFNGADEGLFCAENTPLSTGAIVGIAMGGVAAAICIGVVIWICCCCCCCYCSCCYYFRKTCCFCCPEICCFMCKKMGEEEKGAIELGTTQKKRKDPSS